MIKWLCAGKLIRVELMFLFIVLLFYIVELGNLKIFCWYSGVENYAFCNTINHFLVCEVCVKISIYLFNMKKKLKQ